MSIQLLKELCNVHAPSGNEGAMRDFVVSYVSENSHAWAQAPEVYSGDGFQDCVVLVFGKPSTAIFAHMDSIGFTVRYEDQLVPIGGPEVKTGFSLVGKDSLGPIECTLKVDEENKLSHDFGRAIERGTDLVFKCNFRETTEYVESCYMDNRLGVYAALRVAETLENGVIAFSCWEEHGGGSVPFLLHWMQSKYSIKQALISDITWVTDGVQHGKGVAISLRDRNIPRKAFLERILSIADESGIPFQLEVEGAGSSDGREVQQSPYPMDWCFIGAPEAEVHSPNEKVHKDDITSMISLYELLMAKL